MAVFSKQSIAELEFSILELNSSTETISFEFESVISTSERIRREIEELGERKRRESEIERKIFEGSKEDIGLSIERIRSEIDSLQEFYSNEEIRIREDFGNKIRGVDNEIIGIDKEQTTITETITKESRDIRSRIESNNQQLLHEFENGENSEIRWIAREHRKFHAFEHAVLVYKSTHDQNRRIEDYLGKKT
ncbi:MAG: hypothetical protein RLZ33_77 [Bacteroidota bacterium]|jgi:hypothetical protein